MTDYQTKTTEIRKKVLKMLFQAGSGHPGGSLSCVEILTALYYNVMNINPHDPQWDDRDRFVMSKGHGCPTLYVILADLGFFPEKDLWTLRKISSDLQGHPDMHKTPGIDVSTGSLGQGVSIALGMALAAKYQEKDYKVYALIGDGECQEGLVWEMAMAATNYRADNFTVLLDHNGIQLDGPIEEIMSLGDICRKFDAFGFQCFSVDGHDIDAIAEALLANSDGRPKFIECRTVKGKGVSFMENQTAWHGKVPDAKQLKKALEELEVQENG
ncbi:MAG: transketolase [Clostridiales bacterium]|nr:transketolase [Clostridiales bacterium]